MKILPNNSCYTLEEIKQQPRLWQKIYYSIKSKKDEINNFLKPLLDNTISRILLIGSGASAYVGDTLMPYLSEEFKIPVNSIPASEILNNPYTYLKDLSNILVILYSRSGNTKETLDALNTCTKLLQNSHFILVTSNNEGKFSKEYSDKSNFYVLTLPEESNDRGFAMTSSYSCMILSSILLFNINNLENQKLYLEETLVNSKYILNTIWSDTLNIVRKNPSRVLYVGTSELKGMSNYCALNTLKLTNGTVYSLSWSPSDINQSIKPFINDNTLIFLFKSVSNPDTDYNQQFLDIIKTQDKKPFVIVVSENSSYLDSCNKCFYVNYKDSLLPNIYLVLNYVLYAQIFNYMYSLHLGLSPDLPYS